MGFAATILTLYPEMFPGPLGVSLAGRALERGDWSCETVQIRDFATDKHRTVDDTPAGGGAGMVLKPDVLGAAIASVGEGRPILAMTPRGKPISQARIRAIAQGPGVAILCGRFEGFDERIFEAYPQIEQVSLADIVLSGGETATLSVRDNGHGIEDLDALFEPFYTTKQPGEGVGLGLAISSGIVSDLGGRLTARNGEDSGAVFEMQLPILNEAADHQAAE